MTVRSHSANLRRGAGKPPTSTAGSLNTWRAALCLALLGGLCIWEGTMCNHTTGGDTEEALAELTAPPIKVEAFPEYILGLPMVVSITCENPTTKRTFYGLPECDLLMAPGPVEFVFTSSKGERSVLPAASYAGDEDAGGGFSLRPGDSRQMLFDISELEPELQPDTYELQGNYRPRQGSSSSDPVKVTLVAPSASDAEEAAKLRRENDVGEPSWSYFITLNWRTVDAAELSAEAQQALAMHLFLHRAVYGPTKVSDLDPEAVNALAKGPLEGEAAVLRYEILAARADGSAGTEEADILAKWPGLEWRIEEVKEGYGLLSYLRRTRGAERPFEEPPESLPYTAE